MKDGSSDALRFMEDGSGDVLPFTEDGSGDVLRFTEGDSGDVLPFTEDDSAVGRGADRYGLSAHTLGGFSGQGTCVPFPKPAVSAVTPAGCHARHREIAAIPSRSTSRFTGM